MATMIESPLARLTDEQIEELGKEFDSIHDEVFDDLGDRDRRYITSMISMHRRLLVLSRVVLLGSRYRPAWIAGTLKGAKRALLLTRIAASWGPVAAQLSGAG